MEDDRPGGGLDNMWVDNPVDLAVWSGHGTEAPSEPDGSWSMFFGCSHNGTEQATSPDEIHLGEVGTDPFGGDGRAKFVIMDASCSAVLGEIDAVWINGAGQGGIMMRAHQGLAFKDSPNDSDDRLQEFVDELREDDVSNKQAWLDKGELCVAFWCWNSPLIMSFDQTESLARDRQNFESLSRGRIGNQPPSFDGFFVWNYVDNGDC